MTLSKDPTKWILALVALATVAGTATAGVLNHLAKEETRAHADSAFVHEDTYIVDKQVQASIRERDSLIADARSKRDSASLDLLVRACRRRGECP